jgi:WD40 repeat protein
MKPTPRSIKWLLALFAGITLCAAGSKAPAQVGDDVLRFEGHTLLVTTVAFSPDGKRLLVQSGDGMTIHDATTGKKVARLEDPHSARGTSVFSPDGKFVAGVVDFQLNVWDSDTGKRVFQSPSREIAGNDEKVIAFSPDGKLVATPELILTANDGVKVARFTDSEGRPLRLESRVIFTPDGQSLVGMARVGRDTSVVTSRLPEGLAGAKAPVDVVFDTDNSLGKADDIALSVDGQILARLKGRAVALRMLAGGTQPDIECEEPAFRPAGIAFDPRGKYVAVAGGKNIQFFDNASGKTTALFDASVGKGINSLAFSPDGSRMALGMWEEPSVLVWDVATGLKAKIAATEAAAKAEADRLAEIERKTAEIRAKRAEEKRLAEIEAAMLPERLKKAAAEREAKEAEAKRLAEQAAEKERMLAQAAADLRAKVDKIRADQQQELARQALARKVRSQPQWEGFENLDEILEAFGEVRGAEDDTALRRFALYGTPGNAEKASSGDRFDQREAIEAAAEHKNGLVKRSFFFQVPYTWEGEADTKSTVAMQASVPFRAVIPADLRSRFGVCDVDNRGNAVLQDDGKLLPCEGFEANALRQRGWEVYLKEDILFTRLLVHVAAPVEVQKQVAREPEKHVLNIGITNLQACKPQQRGWFRRQALVESNWDCQRLRIGREFGVNGPPGVPNYAVLNGEGGTDNTNFPVAVFADVVRAEIVEATPDGRNVRFSAPRESK